MIELTRFKRLMNENEQRLPLLTLDEFFYENTAEDSIALNQWGFGRPTLAEIWDMLKEIEEMPNIAWIRVALHDDTGIAEYEGKERLELWGDEIIICTSAQASELEKQVNCKWLCSGGAEEWNVSDLDSLFSCRPTVPDCFHCFGIVWD